ncbi:MAG: DUF4012 domain-containing protein [bacterium]
MPRIIDLSSQVKKQKTTRHSPHVLDLRKEMAGKKEKQIFEKQNKVKKILNSTASRSGNLKKKICKIPAAINNNFKNIKNSISEAGLELNFFKNKFFKSDVSNLFAAKHESAKTRKHENKKTRNQINPPFAKGSASRRRGDFEIKKPRIYKIISDSESSPIATPFYIFRFKNALANLLLFLLFTAILILPIKGFIYAQKLTGAKTKIIDHAASAAEYLKEVKNSAMDADIESIKNQFDKASSEFILARKEADEIDGFTKTLIKIIPRIGGSFKSGENVLIAGECLAKSGQYFVEIADILQNNIAAAQSPTDRLEAVKTDLSLSLIQIKKAIRASEQIDIENIPAEYQEEISKIKNYLPEILEKTEKLIHYIEISQKILGHNELKRYLFVFQNNNEIRATGGFAGSYALIDFNNGKIENLEIPAGGSYDLEGGETKNIIAPEPLQLINADWHFWDANWFFDFPTSAEKLIEFYNNSGGPTVDGVIAINAGMMQEIVGAIGAVSVPGYEKSIDGGNFIQLLQEEGNEHKFEKEPKKFLSLAGPEIIKKLINQPENLLNILPILSKGLAQKDLQFYFSSYDLEREIMDLGWSGRILDASKDYLAAVHTNLGGGKTDQVIKNEIWHNAEILENGEVVDTLIITRFHQGKKGDPFTGIANNDYLRVYVPLGSKLISAYGFSEMPQNAFKTPQEGFKKDELVAQIEEQTETDRLSGTKIFTESNKTVFGNWIHLEPGESKSVYLKYRLPFVISQNKSDEDQSIWEQVSLAINPKEQPQFNNFSDCLSYYSLLLQKQSGISNTNFTSRIKSLLGNKVSWSYPDDWASDGDVQERSFVLDKDAMEAAVFE